VNDLRNHFDDKRGALEYPTIMAKPLPKGVDVRGQYEMELHWQYRQEVLKRKNDPLFPAVSDPEQAGWRPVSLEVDHE
jgi:hypothetical protein